MTARTLRVSIVLGLLVSSLVACSAEEADVSRAPGGESAQTPGTGVPAPAGDRAGGSEAGDDAGLIRGDVVLSPGNALYPSFGEPRLFDGYLVSRLASDKQYLTAEFIVDDESVLAGDVVLNGNALELGSNEGYFSYRGDPGFPGVAFDGSTHTWSVSGGDGAPAFTASVRSPTAHPELTRPASLASVPRAGFTVEWSGVSEDVLVELYQLDAGYNIVAAIGKTARGGRLELAAADLAHLEPGKATLRVIRFEHDTIAATDGRRFKVMSSAEAAQHVVLE